jgi:hypothetical protein
MPTNRKIRVVYFSKEKPKSLTFEEKTCAQVDYSGKAIEIKLNK